MEEWTSGALVATGALGAGVDVEGIKHVVHIGMPYGLINFDQESGRGGRGGEEVKSRILLSVSEMERLERLRPETLPIDDRAMQEFIVTKTCRRLVRSKYMNGEEEAKRCVEVEGVLCDRCQVELAGTDLGKRQRLNEEAEVTTRSKRRRYGERNQAVIEEEQARGLRRIWVERTIESLQGQCEVCWLIDGETPEHSRDECDVFEAKAGRSYGLVRRDIRFDVNACCMACGRPGDMCLEYSSRVRCITDDTVILVAVAAWVFESAGMRSLIMELAERGFEDVASYLSWLGRKRRVLEENATNAFGVFEAITERRGKAVLGW